MHKFETDDDCCGKRNAETDRDWSAAGGSPRLGIWRKAWGICGLLIAVSAGLASPCSADDSVNRAVNLIKNGDFANTKNGRPEGWRESTWGGSAKFAVDESVGHTAAPSVVVASSEGADASWSFRVELKPRTDYRLSAWIKTESVDAGTGSGALMNLHELQMEGKSLATTGTTEWTQVTTEFHSGTHTSLLVNLLLGGWGRSTGKVWFDDVELIQIGPVIPTMTENEAIAFFETRVKPILIENCYSCHFDDKEDLGGKLNLGSRKTIEKGGESGPAVDLKEPLDSLLIKAINYDVYEMPPDGKLPKKSIADITLWVRLGMPWSADGEIAEEPKEEHASKITPPAVDDHARSWWSFQKVKTPELPPVVGDNWSINEIDKFVNAKRKEKGLNAAPAANRATLIRRAHYDLLGLPPTLEQVRQFVDDPDPQAYEKLIDRLLDSPHYGEKWGRHWLDLVRYAESNSFERDGTKPFVWRYRDYVIRAFNQDMPYDRFLFEQLAGDELPEVTAESLAATGYFRIGQWDDEPADPEQSKYDDLDDILATTSQTMLGLTVNCARCHDHKIDPIPQSDYYQMLAFFHNIRHYGIRADETVRDASVRKFGDAVSKAAARQLEQSISDLKSRAKSIEDIGKQDFIPVEHEEFQYEFQRIPLLQKRVGRALTAEQFDEYCRLVGEIKRLQQGSVEGEQEILCVKESGPEVPDNYVLMRGNPHVHGAQVQPGFLSVLSLPVPEIKPTADNLSSGLRTAFAKWLTNPDHPLTSRVMVNRLWQYHFGKGIVRTTSDFGFQGSPPTHPELLDWLADKFVDNGWSMKSMHRLMMLSQTYRMSAEFDPAAYAVDPENDYLWRFNMRRLTAEEIRDSILMVSGKLNLGQLFGPSVYPVMPPEILAGQSMPGNGWPTSIEDDQNRRSVYVHVKRSMRLPLLANFDGADGDFTCPIRFVTTQPTQALGLINSKFSLKQATSFAESMRQAAPNDLNGQVFKIISRVTQRNATAEEVAQGVALISDWTANDGLDADTALRNFCLLALNLNEFVYLD